jgi:DNA gyrase subunit A
MDLLTYTDPATNKERHIDEDQATAILDLQWRRLAAMERQRIIDRLAELERVIADLRDILASDERQRQIISTELQDIVDKYGDERRTRIISADGDLSEEDLIAREDVVVTITHGGYAKRTKADLYRLQKRGGKGVKGATLRADDEVAHLFSTNSHEWLLFFTTKGRVYRTKVWQLPEGGREAKGGHVAGLLSFAPDEKIAQVLTLGTYSDADYLLLATRKGLVKKTVLTQYDSPRQAGLIAVNFRDEDDELIGAALCNASDDVLLISIKGQSIRFAADDEQLRPMGRATSGVTGMRFRGSDALLSMAVIGSDTGEDDRHVFTVTDGGFAKRTTISEYRTQGRGGLGIKAMKLNEDRGKLVGGLIVSEDDEVIAIKTSGQIIRSSVSDVAVKGRDTMGVKFVGLRGDDQVAAIALYPDSGEEMEADDTPGIDTETATDNNEGGSESIGQDDGDLSTVES